MALYIDPMKKNFFSVKAVVDIYYRDARYSWLIMLMGGPFVVTNLILAVISVSVITVDQAVSKYMKLISTTQAYQEKQHDLMMKIIRQLA